VAYYAASVDTAETNKSFAESLELDYPVLSDPDKQVAQAYGVLSPAGYASRWTFYIGKDGKVLYVDRQVKPGDHGKDIGAKLRELGIPERGAGQGEKPVPPG
jgi:thioredoxin-dependent peroxiredoxin